MICKKYIIVLHFQSEYLKYFYTKILYLDNNHQLWFTCLSLKTIFILDLMPRATMFYSNRSQFSYNVLFQLN